MHLFTPNHVHLLDSCYPSPSALLSSGSGYLPNAQELSRLTYYASNHPGKLTKLGLELEKRVKTESRKAHAGNQRMRMSLLITLSIFLALTTECRRDIALLSQSLMSSVNEILDVSSVDLEIVAKAASLFTAWTTFTDGHILGTDNRTNLHYLSALRHFSLLSLSAVVDEETRNRSRLIGFAALVGASNSDSLCHDSVQFTAQVSRIVPPILTTLFQTEIRVLELQATSIKDEPRSPHLTEFRTQPAVERRPVPIHGHVDREGGPSIEDVANAALHCFFSLVNRANGGQLGLIMQSSFNSLDESQAWGNSEHCCWLARKTVEWSQYQYRFAVPAWLIDRLCKSGDTLPFVSTMHTALAAMTTTVFSSSVPLVNLSTSDMMSSLIAQLLRRVGSDQENSLIQALIDCISSLGRHIYYSDQIQDLAGELISRLTVVETQGALNRGNLNSEKHAIEATRALLAALIGLLKTANKNDCIENDPVLQPPTTEDMPKDSTSALRIRRRASVPPEMWQETLSLVCDHHYASRADYTDALIFYIREEMPKSGECVDKQLESDVLKHPRQPLGGPIRQALNIGLLLHPGNSVTKFIHAIHAYLYTLATSSSLGLIPSPSTSSRHSAHDDLVPSDVAFLQPQEHDSASLSPSQVNGRRSFSLTHHSGRKLSMVKHLLRRVPSQLSASSPASACLSDYALLLNILTVLHEEFPVRALLSGVPMLVALDLVIRNSNINEADVQRINVLQEVVSKVWLVLGKLWRSSELVRLAESALTSGPAILPTVSSNSHLTILCPARSPIDFPEVEATGNPREGVDVENALSALTNCPTVLEATGLDQEGLLRRLSIKWTAEFALAESMERTSLFENNIRGEGLTPLLKISPSMMNIENISQQSLSRPTRGVGVADLRGALEGRSSVSNPALNGPPSFSTLEHGSTAGEALHLRLTKTRSRGKKRAPLAGAGDVRDVLHKLGLGRQNGSFLKASLPTPEKSGQRATG